MTVKVTKQSIEGTSSVKVMDFDISTNLSGLFSDSNCSVSAAPTTTYLITDCATIQCTTVNCTTINCTTVNCTTVQYSNCYANCSYDSHCACDCDCGNDGD